MNCDECRKALENSVGELNRAEESSEAMSHLHQCSTCRKYSGFLSKLNAGSPLVVMPSDESFWVRQRSAIVEKISIPPSSFIVSRWVLIPALSIMAIFSVWLGRARTLENIRIAQNMEFLQNLDMVEDLDLIEQLDVLDQA